jgi:hypothetical protein
MALVNSSDARNCATLMIEDPVGDMRRSMKTAAIVSVGPSERQQIPFRMTIISDMIQNTAPIRQFNSEANFQQLARSPAWTSLRPSLFGMYQTSPDP